MSLPRIVGRQKNRNTRFDSEVMSIYNLNIFIPEILLKTSNPEKSDYITEAAMYLKRMNQDNAEFALKLETKLWTIKWEKKKSKLEIIPASALEALAQCQ